MKVDVYNQEGKVVGQADLPETVFGVKLSKDLLHQVVVGQMANRRQNTAHAKDRGEVRGGGRKPWRQKGTGRARHGSNRSPIWKGGGVTFGPLKDRVYKQTIPSKMRQKALLMVLSEKVKNNFLILIDTLKINQGKTKMVANVLKKLPGFGKTALIGLTSMDKDFILASHNIPKVNTMQLKDLNAFDLLNSKYFIIEKDGIKFLEERFGGEKSQVKIKKEK